MKNFIANNKRIFIRISVAISAIIALILSGLILLNVVKNNNIKRINTEIESVHTAFENTDDRTEKYNILTDFIDDSEIYSKYQETEKNYQNKISEMKNYFGVSYENLIKENSVIISDETTKDELNALVSNLNELKLSIDSDEINDSTLYIAEIDKLIESYGAKISEIEEAEKAEEERLKKETEEKAKKEAETVKKATVEAKKNNNSNANSSTNKGDSSNNYSENKTNNGSNSNYSSNNNSSTPKFDPSKPYRVVWDVDENGNEIPGTRVYCDDNLNVFDSNYNYLGNDSEWGNWIE